MDEKNNIQTNNEEMDSQVSAVESEIRTRFSLLPTEIQETIQSSDYQMKLFEIAKKHKLTYEKLGQIELETTMVLLGMTPPDEFKFDINEQLKLSPADLDSVVLDINEQIFKPIRDKLMRLYSEKEVLEGEKYAKEVTNPNQVRETKASVSPTTAVNPSLDLSKFTPTPGITSGNIPTTEKNESDAKKETSPAKIDPYRELPMGEIKSQAPAPLSKDFMQGIPTLTEVKKEAPVQKTIPQGGISTMMSEVKNLTENKATPVQTTNSALKSISSLKNILSKKVATSTSEKIVAPQVTAVNKSVAPVNSNTVVSKEVIEVKKEGEKNPILNFDLLGKLTSKEPSPKVVNEVKTGLIDSVESDLETLNKKIDTLSEAKIPQITLNPIKKPVEGIASDIKNMAAVMPKSEKDLAPKNPGLYDDSVKFMTEKEAKPGFFSKLKKMFGPKKAVDVLVTPKVTKMEEKIVVSDTPPIKKL